MEASPSLFGDARPAPAEILAVDPGLERSAWVVFDPAGRRIREMGIEPNDDVLELLRLTYSPGDRPALLAVEMVASYGMPVGRDVFETVLWIGRFIEAWAGRYRKVYRKEVALHLCGSARAKDPNVRQALLDLFPRTGGGATPQVGTKSKPGPLYGVKADLWSALGVAVTAAETREKRS